MCPTSLSPPGSSPHTRGAPVNATSTASTLRIIPAYAGSTNPRSCSTVAVRDHPRIRGEHLAPGTSETRQKGSSPHTRGALSIANSCGGRARIIPAYAGSTSACLCLSISSRDHPRIRGEHVPTVRAAHVFWGSSPHTRGAHARGIQEPFDARIIPAYAGSTSKARRR